MAKSLIEKLNKSVGSRGESAIARNRSGNHQGNRVNVQHGGTRTRSKRSPKSM